MRAGRRTRGRAAALLVDRSEEFVDFLGREIARLAESLVQARMAFAGDGNDLGDCPGGSKRGGEPFRLRLAIVAAVDRQDQPARGVRRGYYTDNREDALIMWRDADPEPDGAA